jgi:hypothetical protein
MFGVLLVLVYAYAFEYVRYKTIRPRTPRKSNKVLFGWLALIGFFSALRISPLVAPFVWVVALLAYLWDDYVVDKMP